MVGRRCDQLYLVELPPKIVDQLNMVRELRRPGARDIPYAPSSNPAHRNLRAIKT